MKVRQKTKSLKKKMIPSEKALPIIEAFERIYNFLFFRCLVWAFKLEKVKKIHRMQDPHRPVVYSCLLCHPFSKGENVLCYPFYLHFSIIMVKILFWSVKLWEWLIVFSDKVMKNQNTFPLLQKFYNFVELERNISNLSSIWEGET